MISAKAKPSTYYVLNWVENSNKNSKVKYVVKGMGSAVAIKEDMLATACHVVTNYELDNEGLFLFLGSKYAKHNKLFINCIIIYFI